MQVTRAHEYGIRCHHSFAGTLLKRVIGRLKVASPAEIPEPVTPKIAQQQARSGFT